MGSETAVTFIYSNWRHATARRTVIPSKIWFGVTEWHPEPQWLMDAYDCDKKAMRTFAVQDITDWSPEMGACVRTAQVRAVPAAPTPVRSPAPIPPYDEPGPRPGAG